MKQPMKSPAAMLAPGRVLTIANVAEGAEGLVISDLARAIAAQPKRPAVSLAVVCRDGARMQQLGRALEFFAPDIAVMQVPAWDCQPYDRVSPHSGILAQRLTALAKLPLGLEDDAAAVKWEEHAKTLATEGWMLESTRSQLERLKGLLRSSPLKNL